MARQEPGERRIAGDYLAAYGLTPATDPADTLTGTYTRNYSATLVAPWLWNAQKKVFLSTEDEQSIGAKADYVVNKGIGGIMIWELAGDYAFNAARNEYFIGNTLTNLIYDKFTDRRGRTAPPRPTSPCRRRPSTSASQIGGFALGDNNYPINPELRITNNSTTTIPAGAQLEFDYPTSAPAGMGQQSGWALTAVSVGHTGNNLGGLRGDFHRVRLTLPQRDRARRVRRGDAQLLAADRRPVQLHPHLRRADLRAGRRPRAGRCGADGHHRADGVVHGQHDPDGVGTRLHRPALERGDRLHRRHAGRPTTAAPGGPAGGPRARRRAPRGSGVWEDLGPCGPGPTTTSRPPTTTTTTITTTTTRPRDHDHDHHEPSANARPRRRPAPTRPGPPTGRTRSVTG